MRQITIVAPDRPGLVAEITEALAAPGINIESLSAERVAETAAVILSVERYDEALAALVAAGFDAVSEDALVLRLKDEPGALAKLARRFSDAGVNMRSMRTIRRMQGWGLVAVAADDLARARELVKDLLVS